MDNHERLSTEEISSIVSGLGKLEPGALPFDIFHAVTRLVATPIIELVPVRRNESGAIEILLLRRDANDPVWPNQLHTPGTVVRGSDMDASFADAFYRISKELGEAQFAPPTFVKNMLHHSGRGVEVAQIYWTDLSDADVGGEFFLADSLPEEIVQSQLDFIPDAVEHFRSTFK